MPELKPHQLIAADFLRDRQRAILADPPRVGKTFPTTVVALERRSPSGVILIVAPSSAKFVWRDAFYMFSPETPCRVVKTKADAVGALDRGFAGVVVVPWGLLTLVPPDKVDVLILDEVHRMQSKKALRTKAAMGLMAKAKTVFALSGTVMLNRPINLWALLFGLKIIRMDWFAYAHKFCKAWAAPWGFDTSGASNLPELKAIIKPHLLRRSKSEVFTGYTPPEFRLVTFDRPVQKQESAFDANALSELVNPILSIEGLSELLHEGALKKVPDVIEFVSGLLEEEADMKMVLFAYHVDVIEALAAGLKAYRPVTVTGAVNPELRESRRLIFQNNKACRLFIGNIIACSEGIDLSAADTVGFIETTWSPALLEQAAARVENVNKVDSAALAYLFTIEKSLDHYVLAKLLKKMAIIGQVIPQSSRPDIKKGKSK